MQTSDDKTDSWVSNILRNFLLFCCDRRKTNDSVVYNHIYQHEPKDAERRTQEKLFGDFGGVGLEGELWGSETLK